MLLLCIARRDRDGVEDAKAHSADLGSVMARRPADGDGVGDSFFDYGVHCIQRPAGGAQRRVQGFRRNDGVASAQLVEALEDLALGQLNVAARVAQRELIVVGDAWRNRNQIQITQRAQRGVESRWLLRMLRTGQVFFANWIRGKPCHRQNIDYMPAGLPRRNGRVTKWTSATFPRSSPGIARQWATRPRPRIGARQVWRPAALGRAIRG